MIPALLSIGVLMALALIGVGLYAIITRRGDGKRAWLMVGAGAVLLLNVWLYAQPLPAA